MHNSKHVSDMQISTEKKEPNEPVSEMKVQFY